MNDLISRQAAIDAFLTELTKRERKNLLHTWSTVEVKYFVVDMLEKSPSAQRTGRWIYNDEAYPGGNPYGHYECDQCGEYVPHKTNYCPNCGADMRGEQDE